MAGLEVEALEPVAPPFDKVVVAEVLSVEKHPDADRLNVCQVDVGAGEPLHHRLRRAECACRAESAVRAGRRASCPEIDDQAGQGARRRIVRHAVFGARNWAWPTKAAACCCCLPMRRSDKRCATISISTTSCSRSSSRPTAATACACRHRARSGGADRRAR